MKLLVVTILLFSFFSCTTRSKVISQEDNLLKHKEPEKLEPNSESMLAGVDTLMALAAKADNNIQRSNYNKQDSNLKNQPMSTQKPLSNGSVSTHSKSVSLSNGGKKIDHKYFTLKLDETYNIFNLDGKDSQNYSAQTNDQSTRLETEFGALSLSKDKIVSPQELQELENFQWINLNKSAITYTDTGAKFRNISGSIYVSTESRYIKVLRFSTTSVKYEKFANFLVGNLNTK